MRVWGLRKTCSFQGSVQGFGLAHQHQGLGITHQNLLLGFGVRSGTLRCGAFRAWGLLTSIKIWGLLTNIPFYGSGLVRCKQGLGFLTDIGVWVLLTNISFYGLGFAHQHQGLGITHQHLVLGYGVRSGTSPFTGRGLVRHHQGLGFAHQLGFGFSHRHIRLSFVSRVWCVLTIRVGVLLTNICYFGLGLTACAPTWLLANMSLGFWSLLIDVAL